MPMNPSTSVKWCCENLIEHDSIEKIVPLNENTVQLQIIGLDDYVHVLVLSMRELELSNMPKEIHSSDVHFLVNIPKNAVFKQDLLEFAEVNEFGIGGVSDFYSAANQAKDLGHFKYYVHREVEVIIRALSQHTVVSNISRINNRMYRIERHSKATVKVLALNEYDLTIDALRTGVQRYGKPDYVLTSNPNCRDTSLAKSVASDMGIRILSFSQLMGVLNN